MNDIAVADRETADTATPDEKPRSRLDAMAQEYYRLVSINARGELAALRRMDPDHPSAGALFRLLARAGVGDIGLDSLKRWACAAHIMAQRPDRLRRGNLGQSLADIGLSEQRLDMLLNARGATLRDLARRTARRLANSEEAMPYRELCRLVLLDGQSDREIEAEELRIRIAQSFQRAARNI